MPWHSFVAGLLAFGLALGALPQSDIPASSAQPPDGRGGNLFARENLVAWCIVPFDAQKRGPEERAEMLARLGFKRFAYDWRAEHLPSFEAELDALRRHGIRLQAVWFPAALNADARTILDLLERHQIQTELWVSMSDPAPASQDEAAKVQAAADALRPMVEEAARIGCTVGLYNHGGWFGEPEHQVAILEHLKLPNAGMVYNLHHGHDHLPRFTEVLEKMQPHLLAVNLNGMVPAGDRSGKKILPLGQGELDLDLLKTIRDSGYRGPIGILGHTQDDAEDRLQDNLDGLDWLVSQLDGQEAGPRPVPRTLPKVQQQEPAAREASGASQPARAANASTSDDRAVQAEVVVYGGTPAGVMAAIAAARQGHTVALIDVNSHVGGVVSGGLVDTDIGDRTTVGGLADDFLQRTARFYREKYGADSQQFAKCHDGLKYEPHVAEMVFEAMLAEQPRVTLWRKHRYRSVTVEGGRITSLAADDVVSNTIRTFSGQMFIDASYEGDVMAAARVPYRVGREARQEFGEYLAGISAGPRETLGLGDHRTMAYNYRVSITSRTENRVLFPRPEDYDPEPWRNTYGARILRTGITSFADLYVNAGAKAGPNDKFDTNWGDLDGGSEGYAEGDWATRDRIAARHRDYFLSLLYYLQNDPELPEAFRADARTWGLPQDEFTDNGHFPFQLYVRAARRMLGRYVLREHDLTQDRYKPDGVCAGSYGIDSHVVQHVLHEGQSVVDHTRHTALEAYDIPYACLTPHEPDNLLVPVCCSATHVAYCSLRMEPVYMMLGQAAGSAAHLALAGRTSVQHVDVPQLRALLQSEGAVLDAGYQPQVKIAWTPRHPRPEETVQFHVEIGDLKEPLTQVWWGLQGNGIVSSQHEACEASFPLDKLYTVSLVVQDQAGRRRLVEAEVPVGQAAARDVTLDNFDAELYGRWNGAHPRLTGVAGARNPDVFTGPGAHYDVVRNGKKAVARARFRPDLPRAGRYQVCLGFRPAKNQATNVPVTIRHAGGVDTLTVDQRQETTPLHLFPLGEFSFDAGNGGYVEIRNAGTNGRVAIDGVRWVWMGD